MTRPTLDRHFGLLHATALNVTMMIGSGVFVIIAPMLAALPGPYAMLGWLAGGVLIIMDGLVWSELGATLPGSGGSYLYLLECYGRQRWGRFMAFLFIWQFLISGPLEIASGLIIIGSFTNAIDPAFADFNRRWSMSWNVAKWQESQLLVSVEPSRVIAFFIGLALVWLLYRRITALGKLTVAFSIGVLAVCGWILVEGWLNFDAGVAFDFSGSAAVTPDLIDRLGPAMIPAIYCYLGYYNICYIGDEVREPGRTIPRSIVLSAILVGALYVGLHLAMLGTVPWQQIPKADFDAYNLPADFMSRIHEGSWAPRLVSALLIWSCIGAAFAGLLGYSRIPYGAARYGHFFAALGRVHPVHHLPHLSLFLVGGLTLFWSFFGLGEVINALITTRILQQFVGQIIGLVLLRRLQPDRVRPYKMWLYPLPCVIAAAGWIYVYFSAGWAFMLLGIVTLALGSLVFFVWRRTPSGTD
jgi:amino acid transporter